MFAVAQTWHPSARVAPRDLKARHKRVSRAHRRGRVVINVLSVSDVVITVDVVVVTVGVVVVVAVVAPTDAASLAVVDRYWSGCACPFLAETNTLRPTTGRRTSMVLGCQDVLCRSEYGAPQGSP